MILAFGASLYLLFVMLVVLDPYITNYFSRTEFDSEKWKTWKENEVEMSLRWNMIADLEDNHDLEGMTDKEIVDLLGEPDSKVKAEWTYYLGMAGHGIDTGTLTLNLKMGRSGVSRYTEGNQISAEHSVYCTA